MLEELPEELRRVMDVFVEHGATRRGDWLGLKDIKQSVGFDPGLELNLNRLGNYRWIEKETRDGEVGWKLTLEGEGRLQSARRSADS